MKNLLCVAAIAVGTLTAIGTPAASAATRQYEGTVVSVNRTTAPSAYATPSAAP